MEEGHASRVLTRRTSGPSWHPDGPKKLRDVLERTSGLLALRKARAHMAGFFHIVEQPGEIQRRLADGGASCPAIETLKLREVHFAYPARPGVEVLRGVSLLVEKGRWLWWASPAAANARPWRC